MSDRVASSVVVAKWVYGRVAGRSLKFEVAEKKVFVEESVMLKLVI